MKKLDPKALWLFLTVYIIGISVTFTLFIFFFSSIFNSTYPVERLAIDMGTENDIIANILTIAIKNWVFIYLAFSLLGILYSKLWYDTYKYELTENGFKSERGVISKSYVTIPYERIQNVDIIRGPITRMFGLSVLQIQTAGISGVALVEGRLPGLNPNVAEKLRDELVKRARTNKNQGV